MSKLVIVESPSKAKTIERYLGGDYKVVSSKGHIRDLATTGKGGLGIDIENDFKPEYVDNKDKKDVIEDLGKKIKKASEVLLATDPDREGEAIAWHLATRFDLDLNKANRVVFNEITKPVVSEAINQPKKVDMMMVSSQETRRMLDRIIGFKLSTLLKNKIKSKSAGRVQSVALKLIVDREEEIRQFVPEEYWSVLAQFNEQGIPFEATLNKIAGKKVVTKTKKGLPDEKSALKVQQECRNNPFTVAEIKEDVTESRPKLPYTTSTLQQDAANKLYFSSKQTMRVAQKLYEGVEIASGLTGLITYMRTDSVRMSNVFLAQGREYINETYGKEYAGYYHGKTDKNAQDAHEAIRPTSIYNTPKAVKEYLSGEEYKLYKMIYCRSLAAMMKPAKYNSLNVALENGIYSFAASGKTLIFDGYLKAYGEYEDKDDSLLPTLTSGQSLTALDVQAKQHFTEGPKRYTEARLVKTMEENGIGRPSTYASIIDTILERGYVTQEKSSEGSKVKVFVPTEQGVLTSKKLDEFFSSIINTQYTADMESQLDEIAEGHLDHLVALRKFYGDFMPLMENAYEHMEKLAPEKTGEKCPQCGGDLVYRQGRYGKFIACSNYPDCKYNAKLPKEAPQETGELCPECGSPLVKRVNFRGQSFVGCSAFPKCHYIKSDNSAPRRYVRGKKNAAKS
ncbi:MAG: type I DNA topoisomerase [Erysipelotrichaceae bacterium]|nr:type I DNA topoisomerase [Erysipelotrichaceae bacterium]